MGRHRAPPALGSDPGRLQADKKTNTRIELGPEAYTSGNADKFTERGQKYNTEGVQDMVGSNQYRMKTFDFSKKIYQYDVSAPNVHDEVLVLMNLGHHHSGRSKDPVQEDHGASQRPTDSCSLQAGTLAVRWQKACLGAWQG